MALGPLGVTRGCAQAFPPELLKPYYSPGHSNSISAPGVTDSKLASAHSVVVVVATRSPKRPPLGTV